MDNHDYEMIEKSTTEKIFVAIKTEIMSKVEDNEYLINLLKEIKKRYDELEEKLSDNSMPEDDLLNENPMANIDLEKIKMSWQDVPSFIIPQDSECCFIDRTAERMMDYLSGMEQAVADIKYQLELFQNKES